MQINDAKHTRELMAAAGEVVFCGLMNFNTAEAVPYIYVGAVVYNIYI